MLLFYVFVRSAQTVGHPSVLTTFDAALTDLGRLDRMFIEPDGSFVWTGTTSTGNPWQVDGNLIDRGDCLAYVELKGRCPSEQFDQVLAALGWPQVALEFEITQRGVVVDEPEFRRLAASQAGAV